MERSKAAGAAPRHLSHRGGGARHGLPAWPGQAAPPAARGLHPALDAAPRLRRGPRPRAAAARPPRAVGALEKVLDNMLAASRGDGREMALKPMSFPCHLRTSNAELRSRISEFGICHRNEGSGDARPMAHPQLRAGRPARPLPGRARCPQGGAASQASCPTSTSRSGSRTTGSASRCARRPAPAATTGRGKAQTAAARNATPGRCNSTAPRARSAGSPRASSRLRVSENVMLPFRARHALLAMCSLQRNPSGVEK